MGVYWRGGSLLSRVTEPGLRLKVPFLDVHSSIQVTLQTDKVSDIPCGTKGVMVTFDKVEVRVNISDSHALQIAASIPYAGPCSQTAVMCRW